MDLSYQILKERYIDLRKSHKTLHDEVLRLQQENQQLKDIIDKGLNELDTYRIDLDMPSFTDKTIINTRKILRGKNNERY